MVEAGPVADGGIFYGIDRRRSDGFKDFLFKSKKEGFFQVTLLLMTLMFLLVMYLEKKNDPRRRRK